VIVRRQIDDACSRGCRYQHDSEPEFPAERSTWLAEEHEHPPTCGWSFALRVHLEDVNQIGDVLQTHSSSVAVLDPSEPTGKPVRGFAHECLATMGARAETGCDVQRRPPETAVLDLHRLSRVDADADTEWKLRVDRCLLVELLLEIDRRTDRLARRSEDDEGFVASNLDGPAAVRLDALAYELGEPRGQERSCFVSVLLCVTRIPAYVGDQERAGAGVAVLHDIPVCAKRDTPAWAPFRSCFVLDL
jgi:hypothetical protein